MAQPIFLYWHQGWDNAPELVQRCAESWIHHHRNTEWEVHLLHRGSIESLLSKCAPEDWAALLRFEQRMATKEKVGGLNNFANLLRLSLLDHYGGVWTDATTLCFKPLDDWLPEACSVGMPRSMAQSRRTETWFIDNRCKDPVLTLWKNRYRDLYFTDENRITYLDEWGIPRYRLSYWLINLSMRNKNWAMRIWNGRLALKLMKVRPYFATNHILEYVLRHEISAERIPVLHHLILPLDAELIWEVHVSDWSQAPTPFMEKRLRQAPLIKLNHKSQWIKLSEKGAKLKDSAWSQWMARAIPVNPS